MFKPAPMVQINALVLQRDERTLLNGLGTAGVVHLSRTDAGPQTAPQVPPDKSPELSRCDDLLRRIENLHHAHGVAESPPDNKILALPLDQVDERLQAMELQLENLTQRRTQLEQQWSQIIVLLNQLSGYEELDLPLEEIGQSAFLHFAIGSLPARNLDNMRQGVAENVVLIPLDQKGDRQPVLAVTSRKGRFAMETALKQAGFRHEKPPVEEGRDIVALTEDSRVEQTRLADELDAIRDQQQCLAAELASN